VSHPHGTAQRFLVEWYQAGLASAPLADTAARLSEGAAAACVSGTPVSVLLTVATPLDEMLFGVFCADNAEVVRRVCRDAGYPADRVTGDVRSYIVEGGEPGTQ
jgi:hypothetical protein